MQVKIKKLHKDAVVPKYQSSGASGFDLHSLEDVSIRPGDTTLIKTGLSFSIPQGYEMQIRPRSGLSLKTSFRINNSPGTIDSDFRGEVCIIGMNIDIPMEGDSYSEGRYFKIKKGDRIAQGVICPIIQVEFTETDTLENTERGAGGFGSSGS